MGGKCWVIFAHLQRFGPEFGLNTIVESPNTKHMLHRFLVETIIAYRVEFINWLSLGYKLTWHMAMLGGCKAGLNDARPLQGTDRRLFCLKIRCKEHWL